MSKNKEELLQQLLHYWENNPHLRLGQIVVNAWRVLPQYQKNPEPEISDLFYIENDKLLEGLKQLENL
jgi:hypothetical protein